MLFRSGKRGYQSYWSHTIARFLLSAPPKKILTVRDIRDDTYIVQDDIITTLQAMQVLDQKKRGGADAVINKAKVRAWAEAHKVDPHPPVDIGGFVQMEKEDEQQQELEEEEGEGEVE